MYNKYFKIAAALLVGIIFAACGSIFANGIISIESRKDSVYRFEPSFRDSHYIREKLSEPIWAVANAYLYVENYMGENDIVIVRKGCVFFDNTFAAAAANSPKVFGNWDALPFLKGQGLISK